MVHFVPGCGVHRGLAPKAAGEAGSGEAGDGGSDHPCQEGREEEANGAQDTDDDEKPEEYPVDDHSHVLPVLLHLQESSCEWATRGEAPPCPAPAHQPELETWPDLGVLRTVARLQTPSAEHPPGSSLEGRKDSKVLELLWLGAQD